MIFAKLCMNFPKLCRIDWNMNCDTTWNGKVALSPLSTSFLSHTLHCRIKHITDWLDLCCHMANSWKAEVCMHHYAWASVHLFVSCLEAGDVRGQRPSCVESAPLTLHITCTNLPNYACTCVVRAWKVGVMQNMAYLLHDCVCSFTMVHGFACSCITADGN